MTVPLVEFPELVRHYAPFFASVFSEQALIQFQRYVSGLIVSENKSVEGINRIFVHETRNQSSLNRLLNESPFSVEALNRARLALLGSLPSTQFKPKGVLSVDDTLLTHYGCHFDEIAYLFDPSTRAYVLAHDLVNLHYSDDLSDYPAFFALWKPADLERIEQGLRAAGVTIRESKLALKKADPVKWRRYLLGLWRRHYNKPAVAELYESKLVIAQHLLEKWVTEHPELKLPVTFDSWYTQPAFCRFIDQTLQLPYVGTLTSDDQVELATGNQTLKQFAEQLKQEHEEAVRSGGRLVFHKIGISYKGEQETYYSYCHNHRIHNFGRKRLVINYTRADLSDDPIFLISNRLNWQATGITRIRRHRWPVEVYHEEGKAEGLDQYQVRDWEAIYRHITLVAVTYSLLRAAQHDKALSHKLQRELEIKLEGSVPSWRRVMQAHALWSLALFISASLTQNLSLREIMAPLIAAVLY
jgi:hypothetical protein